jgi:probable phosphoglycerate mutase
MTRIYLIRHAEAEGNLYRIAHGQYDSILTDKGWKQVAALEKRFEDKIVDAVYSSDLYRAMATATAIFKPRGLQLHPMTQLREICMGRWEGMPWAHLNRDDSVNMCHFNHQPELYQVEGGESFLQVQQRMVAAIHQIAAAHDGQAVAIVSHGAAIRTVLAAAQGMSISSSWPR